MSDISLSSQGSSVRRQVAIVADWLKRNAVVLCGACAAVLVLFLLEGRYGFNLGDEGFLWYGAQRVMHGEVPLRDFSSYDPGRYYWSAAGMAALGGDGIMALRGAVALFQCAGLCTAIVLIAGKKAPQLNLVLCAAGLTLLAWMFPRHKLFDISISIALIAAVTILVARPSKLRFFCCGVVVGLAAVFGRNHGVYGVVGSIGAMVFIGVQAKSARAILAGIAAWAAGVATGYLPVLVMLVLAPGFADALWTSIRLLLDSGATNLSLPVPWPWLASDVNGVLLGLFFLAVLILPLIAIPWVLLRSYLKQPVAPEVVACAMLGVPYAHFAYSRADVSHLAQGIFPLLIGVFIVVSAWKTALKWPVILVLTAASLILLAPLHPGWQCRRDGCVAFEVRGSTLFIDQPLAVDLASFDKVVDRYAPNGRTFLVAPYWPGAYALFGRRSPMWDIYPLVPRDRAFQEREIERIEKASPGFALLFDFPNDGRDDLRFRHTHFLIQNYIQSHFDPLPQESPSPAVELYKSRP